MLVPRPSAPSGGTFAADGHIPNTHERLPNTEILRQLVEAYGVSNHEGPVRESVQSPASCLGQTRIRRRRQPDPASRRNSCRLKGTAHPRRRPHGRNRLHVKSISKDGRLEVEWRGGGELSFFAGHPALVHTATGDLDAIVELPNGWDTAEFQMANGRRGARLEKSGAS